jgi:hypothetical protein
MVKKLFPNHEVLSNYSPSLKLFKGHVEFDVCVPSLSLALEYNGTHHCILKCKSEDNLLDSSVNMLNINMDGTQQQRDKQKENVSKAFGFTFITIPYWWGNSEEVLKSLIAEQRPDLFTDQNPLHLVAPKSHERPHPYTPFKPQNLRPEMRLTDCIISEKYDGIRVFWDGSKLFTAFNNNEILLPESLRQAMPSIPIEGELW